jgi:hypothetical protein
LVGVDLDWCDIRQDVDEDDKNSYIHGYYAAETIATRREIATLLRSMRTLVRAASEDK